MLQDMKSPSELENLKIDNFLSLCYTIARPIRMKIVLDCIERCRAKCSVLCINVFENVLQECIMFLYVFLMHTEKLFAYQAECRSFLSM